MIENKQPFKRSDIDFYSKGTRLSGWLYLPTDDKNSPIIITAQGLGAIREMRLIEYAERFTQEGYGCFVFDYRNLGASDGKYRQKINAKEQLEDWCSAIEYIKNLEILKGRKIIIFGSSLSAGHVITIAAKYNGISAAIAQCPYTDGLASIKSANIITTLKVTGLMILDLLSCITGYHPIKVKLAGKPGQAALMAVPDYNLYLDQVPKNITFNDKVCARTALEFFKYNPGKFTKDVKCPIFYAVCSKDVIAPAKETLVHVSKSPKGKVLTYPCGHFDIFVGDFYEKAMKDFISFLDNVIFS